MKHFPYFRMSLIALVTLMTATPIAAEQQSGFFGGMTGMLSLQGLDYAGHSENGRLFHLGGGGGSRLKNSPWLMGGSGSSTSLLDPKSELEMHMRYGGVFLLYTQPLQPFKLGAGVFLGGGSYALYQEKADRYDRQAESFFMITPQVRCYYFLGPKIILDLTVHYTIVTTEHLNLNQPGIGLGLLFGKF